MSDRIPTLADICCAIAEGHITASVDGSMYLVNALELRRYLSNPRSFSETPQPPTTLADSKNWSLPTQISVA
jgi:hypothetical protein